MERDNTRAIEQAVLRDFPYPVAVNLAYALRARTAGAGDRELQHLLVTYETVVQLFASVCLLDLVSQASPSSKQDLLEEVFAARGDFRPSPDAPTLGAWIHFIAKSLTRLQRPFLNETSNWTKSDRKHLLGDLAALRNFRNATVHPHPRPSPVEAAKHLPSVRKLLVAVLRRLEFLGGYVMFAVGPRNDMGQRLVTPLRGATPPIISRWLDVRGSLDFEDVVLADPELAECIKLRPFYVAIEGQDDVDRIWAFARADIGARESRYSVVDRSSAEVMSQPRRPLARPSAFLRLAASRDDLNPRTALKLSESAREELRTNAKVPEGLEVVTGVANLSRLPGGIAAVFEGEVSDARPSGVPAPGCSLSLPIEGTPVVVKAPRAGDSADRANALLRAEFDLLSATTSDHVPRPYALLADRDGLLHLVAEHRPGDRLSTMLQTRREGPGSAGSESSRNTEIAMQLIHAVADVHRHGSHGDIKPANILISRSYQLSLIGLGAGALDEEATTEATATFGTRGYVAPELFLPSESPPDRRRADLYSLAVVL